MRTLIMVAIMNNSVFQSVRCMSDEYYILINKVVLSNETMIIITLHYPQLINTVKMLRGDINNLQLLCSVDTIQMDP